MQERGHLRQCLKAQWQRSHGGNNRFFQRAIDNSDMVQGARYGACAGQDKLRS